MRAVLAVLHVRRAMSSKGGAPEFVASETTGGADVSRA